MRGAATARIAFWLGLVSVPLALLAAYGSGWGLWHFRLGFVGVAAATVLAAIAAVAGLIALIRGGGGARGRTLVGMTVAALLLAMMGYWIGRGINSPMIHDVTTDLANPPDFQTLPLRADNLAGLKGGKAEWRALHAAAYGDIAPLRLALPPAAAMAKVRALVAERGWTVASVEANRIEATHAVTPFRFKDDVVIVVTPDEAGSRIDMRSVSRVGLGDLGVNAERVEKFLGDLGRR